MAKSSARYREVYDRVNDYDETVQTLLAFVAFVCHDGQQRRRESEFGLGRRMHTSAQNEVAPNTVITPDCVAQYDDAFGIAAEVKKSLPQDRTLWMEEVRQIRKYDDDLHGWWTDDEMVERSGAVLLLHQSRGRAFRALLEEVSQATPSEVGQSTALVEFNRSDESSPYIFLRREWGVIAQPDLASKLEEGVQIPMEKVLRSFPSIRFYDAKPPLEFMMTTLWIDPLARRASEAVPDEEGGVRTFAVTVDELAHEMQRAYGSGALRNDQRSVQFPRQEWVREALEAFCRLKLASRSEDTASFTIGYRAFDRRTDLLERFVKLMDRKLPAASDAEGAQLPLRLSGAKTLPPI